MAEQTKIKGRFFARKICQQIRAFLGEQVIGIEKQNMAGGHGIQSGVACNAASARGGVAQQLHVVWHGHRRIRAIINHDDLIKAAHLAGAFQ